MSLVVLGLRKRDFWGPRFKGFRELYSNYALIEVASEQWRYSVISILDFIEKNPNKEIYTLKYEDLIKDPDKEILKTMNFVLDNKMTDIKINHDIKTTGFRKWDKVLSKKEVQIVEKRICTLLTDLNYE